LTQEIDSLHTLKLFFNGAVINENNKEDATFNIINSNNQASKTTTNFSNTKLRDGYLGRSSLVFNKKFKKKGRRFGINAAYLFTRLQDDIDQESDVDTLNLVTQNDADKHQTTANAIYVEPLSKKIFAQVFYNFDNRIETGEREVQRLRNANFGIDNNLSRTFENKIRYQRIGTSLRYAHDGINLSAGLAYQLFNLYGIYYKKGDNEAEDKIDKDYDNVIPYISIDISPARNFNFDVSYSRSANQPSIEDLQPIIDNTNPQFIREGNPALLPEIENGFDASISKSWIGPAIRISMFGNYYFYENQFSTDATFDSLTNVRRSYPINIDGGNRANTSFNLSFPIVKNKFTVRTYGGYTYTNRAAIVNGVKNISKTNSTYGSVRFSITPNDNIGLYLNYRNSFSNTKYNIEIAQNQNIVSNEIDVEFNTKLFWGLFLNSNFNQTYYNFNESIPILNASIYKQFFEKKQLETRLSIYDAFNRNTGISRNASVDNVSQSQTAAIGRYVMFSLTYNILGLSDGVQKKGWF